MAIIDISRTLSPAIAVWPGDTRFMFTQTAALSQGDSVNLSTLTLSAHTGSHVDAPYHFTEDGPRIDNLDLRPFWGLAQVVTVQKEAGLLKPEDFAGADLGRARRLLIHSPASELEPTRFPSAFVYPGPELADFLGALGIILFGSDAPSMDAADDPKLPGHNALRRNGIAILEGLDLSQVADGLYELSALPLKIANGDGSPVRAVLKSIAPANRPGTPHALSN